MSDAWILTSTHIFTLAQRFPGFLLAFLLWSTNALSSPVLSDLAIPTDNAGFLASLPSSGIFAFYVFIAIVVALIFVAGILWQNWQGAQKLDWSAVKRSVFLIVSASFIGAGHTALGNTLGHNLDAVILAVALIGFVERLYHNLSTIPNRVAGELESIKTSVVEAIPNALDAKRILVTGTTHGTQLKEMVQVIEGQDRLDGCHNGIGIFLFGATPDDYAQVCEHFLVSVKKTVESMSDMDLDKALPLFAGQGQVVRWVNAVNAKVRARSPSIRAHRILVLTAERCSFLKAIEELRDSTDDAIIANARNVIRDYSRLSRSIMGNGDGDRLLDTFIENAKAGFLKFYKDYCQGPEEAANKLTFNVLVRQSDEIGGSYVYREGDHDIRCAHEHLPRGEFIIFDRKYLVRFNSEAKLLEVFIGELVSEFAKVFTAPDLGAFPRGQSFSRFDMGLELRRADMPIAMTQTGST